MANNGHAAIGAADLRERNIINLYTAATNVKIAQQQIDSCCFAASTQAFEKVSLALLDGEIEVFNNRGLIVIGKANIRKLYVGTDLFEFRIVLLLRGTIKKIARYPYIQGNQYLATDKCWGNNFINSVLSIECNGKVNVCTISVSSPM